jgi:hypothetical protein
MASSQESPEEEREGGGREDGEWIVYDKDEEEERGEDKTRIQERILVEEEGDECGDGERGEGSSPGDSAYVGNSLMMSSYYEITNYIPGTEPGSDHTSAPSPARPEIEFHSYEDHDRSLPPEETHLKEESTKLSVDVNEARLSPMRFPEEEGAFSPPLKTEVILSPTESPNIGGPGNDRKQEQEEDLPSAEREPEIPPQDQERDLEWWKRMNGYSLAALVVGTASIVAYSMARNK